MSLPLTPYSRWESGTNQNSVPANDNSLRDEIFNTDGISDAVTAQPASPADGDWYILAATHTGTQWATFSPNSIAIFYGGNWYEFVPAEGNLVVVDGVIVIFDTGAWVAFTVPATFTGGALTSALDEAKGTNIASASTTNIGAATGNFVHVTGTTTITALGTVQAGTGRVVVFDGILTLTHNATSLILPTGANITTAAGDVAVFRSEGSGNWRCVGYQRANGTPLAGGGTPSGSNTWVQYNNSGAFGAEAAFAYDAATNTLTVDNITTAGLSLTAASATGGAGFRLPHGAAPTSPVNGDVWTTSAGGMYVQINGVTVGPLSAGGGGGLTGFTSALSTASPNNTINASSLIPSGGSASQDGVYGVKGVGALQCNVADNTAAGGNKRGSNAIDLQTLRAANTQVASGTTSVAIGANCTASSISGVSIGTTCSSTVGVSIGLTASSTGNGAVAIGRTVTASSAPSVCIGDVSTATAIYAISIGAQNTSDAKASIALGGYAHTRGIIGKLVRAVDRQTNQGDSQIGQVCYGLLTTTNATPAALTTNGAAAGTTNQLILNNNSAQSFQGTIIAYGRSGSSDWKSWEIKGGIRRGANAAATAVGTLGATVTILDATAGAAAWTIAVAADTTNGGLGITVTGAAATTIDWGGNLHTAERTG